MSFATQYANLETAFKEQVEKDNSRFGIKSSFLPNIPPEGPVDYVLIAMEPSFGGGSGERSSDDQTKNFSGSIEDFILHFCVENYLCASNRTYYLTDLSKGAMPVKIADSDRLLRYRQWYPLLERELNLVLKPDGIVIAVGNVVDSFLREQELPQLAGKILHYSRSAARYRVNMPRRYPEPYSAFAPTVSWADIKHTVQRVMNEAGMPLCEEQETLERLRNGSKLTESKKQLMFTYSCQFKEILGSERH